MAGPLNRSLGRVQQQEAAAPPEWVNPYDAMIEAQMQRMNQPRAPMYSPEEVQQRQGQNQREYELGILGAMSESEGLQGVGGHVLKNALEARKPKITEHGSSDQISGKFTYSPEYLQQREETKLDAIQKLHSAAQLRRDADMREADLKRELAADRNENRVLIKSMGGGPGGVGSGTATVISQDAQGRPIFRPNKGGPLFQYNDAGQALPYTGVVGAKVTGDPSKVPAEIARQMVGLDALDAAINRYEAKLKDYDPRSLEDQRNLQKRAAFKSNYKQYIGEAKEAIQLGALTGPDVGLVTGILADPTGPEGALYGKEGLVKQIGEARAWAASRRAGVYKQYPHAAGAPPIVPPGTPPGTPPVDPKDPDGIRRALLGGK